ncbi:MAG: hypothetical protein ACI4P4_03365 [Faecousia sp.]
MKTNMRRWIAGFCGLALLSAFLLPVSAAGEEKTVVIRGAQDFLEFANNCTYDDWSRDKTVSLEEDITLTGVDFQPIATFGGTFEGNGHTISGLTIEGSFAPTGLFRVLREEGVIRNLNVSASIAPTGEVENTGIIVGENYGTIQNCTVTGTVAGRTCTGGIAGFNRETGVLDGCSVSGAVTGRNMTGGIAGCNAGTITHCRSSAYVNNESTSPGLKPEEIDLDFSFEQKRIGSIDSLTNTTDTGGIAGYSSGEIRFCKNTGVVGYPHIGYNNGGIVGRSCGFLFQCENVGYICGRKDVGGIAGQMEPEVETILSQDYLETLSQQFEDLSGLVDTAGNHAAGAGWAVSSHFERLRSYMNAAQSAVRAIVPTSVDDILAGPNLGALESLAGAIHGMGETAKDLASSVGGSAGTLGSDVGKITNKISDISDTFALAAEDMKENEFISDTSSEDVDAITTGKAWLCGNTAAVNADLNAGGIAGSMSVEAGSDPEDDISAEVPASQRKRYALKIIIQDCTNTGTVTGKRSYVGSICGRMDLGLITGCEGYGQIESESGNYVGGIVGQTSATVQDCFSKCILRGKKYVGGIVGNGLSEAANGASSSVTGCYAMVQIDRVTQYAGAISGGNAGAFVNNFFVSDSLAGIDHTSYLGKAQPISYGDFLALEKGQPGQEGEEAAGLKLPEAFKKLTLRFIADGVVIQTETVDYGASFASEKYPEVPQKDGFSGHWDQAELKNIRFDTTVNAVYTQYVTALQGFEKREDGRSVFLVSGEFDPEDNIETESLFVDSGEISQIPVDWKDTLVKCFSGFDLCTQVLEGWEVRIPDDGLDTHTLRFLPEDGVTKHLAVFLEQDGQWVRTDSEVIGSCLSFRGEGNVLKMAVVSTRPVWWVWIAAAGLALVVLLLLCRLVRKLFRPKRKKAQLVLDPEYQREDGPRQAPKPGKKRWILWLLAGIVLTAGTAGGIWFFLQSDVKTELDACRLISKYADQDSFAMDLTVNAQFGGTEQALTAHMEKTFVDGTPVIVIRQEPVTLYYAKDTVYLENGKGFRVGSSHPDYSQLLKESIPLFRNADIEEAEGSYTVTVRGEDAMGILETLVPTGNIPDMETLTVTLLTGESKLTGITFTAEGSAKEDSESLRVSAQLDAVKQDSSLTVPEAVRSALGRETEGAPVLTDDMIALAQAWISMNRQPLIAADLTLSADCGPVVLRETLTFHQQQEKGITIGCLQKNNYSVYFTGKRICDKNGNVITAEDQPLVESAKLLDIAYSLCMNAGFSCSNNMYTIALDADGMKDAAAAIVPEAAKMALSLESGTLRVWLSDGEISRIAFSCSGSVEIMVAQVGASLSAGIVFREPDTDFRISDKVSAALKR